MDDKSQILLLWGVLECGFLEVTDHGRRHPVDPGNLIQLEIPGLQELDLIRIHSDGRQLHAIRKHWRFICVAGSGVLVIEGFLQTLPRLRCDLFGMFQNRWDPCPIAEQSGTVFLCCHGQTYRLTVQCDGAEPNNPIASDPVDPPDFLRLEDPRTQCLSLVPVNQFQGHPVPHHRHAVRMQWDQRYNSESAVADDLMVGVASQAEVIHDQLSHVEASHFRIGC